MVNMDLPRDAATYMHRVGRTGRYGALGRAISLISPPQLDLLRSFLFQVKGGEVSMDRFVWPPVPAVLSGLESGKPLGMKIVHGDCLVLLRCFLFLVKGGTAGTHIAADASIHALLSITARSAWCSQGPSMHSAICRRIISESRLCPAPNRVHPQTSRAVQRCKAVPACPHPLPPACRSFWFDAEHMQVKPLPGLLSNAPYEHVLPAVEQAALEAMRLQAATSPPPGV